MLQYFLDILSNKYLKVFTDYVAFTQPIDVTGNSHLKNKIICLLNLEIHNTMDKLQLTGQNQGRVFYFRSGHLRAVHFLC